MENYSSRLNAILSDSKRQQREWASEAPRPAIANHQSPPPTSPPEKTFLRRGLYTHHQIPHNTLRFSKNTHTLSKILMALAGARPFFYTLRAEKPAAQEPQRVRLADPPPDTTANSKIVLQPRVCTLRSYGGDRGGVIRANRENEVSRFFEILSDYVESSKKSHDFEIISGRLAMVVFAATVGMEIVTGNSVFRKMDLQGIEEGGGACVAAIACAAVFAWLSSNRSRVGRIFTVSYNTFIDSFIDNIIDGLFYEIDISDWSDEI